MTASPVSKIMSTDSAGSSSSTDYSSELPSSAIPMNEIQMSVCTDTTTSRPNSISRPATPTPATPVLSENGINTPIKRVLSLDVEMRSRKRRRGCLEEENVIYYSSPTSSLRLPKLIPLEDCADSHLTCLPDTSFLRKKKASFLKRRRRRMV